MAAGAIALAQAATAPLDLAIVDGTGPGIDLSTTLAPLTLLAAAIVLLVTEPTLGFVAAALDAGCVGVIGRGAETPYILEQLEGAARGELVLPGYSYAEVLRWRCDRQRQAAGSRLIGRELDVLRAVERGHRTADIASMLFVTEATVKSHLHRIYRKLDASNRTGALRAAGERGLL